MTRWAILAILLVTVGAYQGVRHNGWVYEDVAMQEVAERQPGLSVGILSRNLARLSVWAPAQFFGPSPQVQHAVSLCVHFVNGLLLFAFLRRCVEAVPALVGLAVFLWHPIQVETAAYVASRPDLLMTTWLLIALLLLEALPLPSRGRWSVRWSVHAGAIAAACWLAFSTKQTGVLVVPILMLFRWYQDPERQEGWAWAFAGTCAAGTMLVWSVPADPGALPYDRFWTMAYQSTAFWRQVSLIVWPVGFTIDHNIGITPPWLALAALMGVCGLVVTAWVYRHRAPLVTVMLLWPVLMLAPRFVLRLPEYTNSHQFYPVMPAVCLGVALLAKEHYELSAQKRRSDIRVSGDQYESPRGRMGNRPELASD